MKKSMNSFDIAMMCKEMQILIGMHIEKVYHVKGGPVIFRLRGHKKRYDIYFHSGKCLYMTNNIAMQPREPSPLAMVLRKYISNKKINTIKQHEFDRIVLMEMNSGDKYTVVFEIFGDGNMLLLHGDEIIVAMHSREWKDRIVKPKEKYNFPPKRMNPKEMSLEDMIERMKSSNADVVRTLATRCGFGGDVAEYVCKLSKIDKQKKAKKLSDDEIIKIYEAIKSLFKFDASPVIVKRDGRCMEAAPIKNMVSEKGDVVEYDSFWKAVEECIKCGQRDNDTIDDFNEKLMRQMEFQKIAMKRYDEEKRKMMKFGEAIMSNIELVNDILNEVNDVRKNEGWSGVKKLVKMDKLTNYEESNGKIFIKMHIENETIEVPLDVRKNAVENASYYFNTGKKFKEKLLGAERALKETTEKMKRRETITGVKIKDISEKRDFWFEKYRWFTTSTGKIVIAGRDARTNDEVVRKHLGRNDIFVHADIHGAPSVVLKVEGRLSDEDIEEACAFAVCFSKAWNAKYGSADAYWVNEEQVSKSPPTGGYLPRGSFMIRGKRNYIKGIPLRLGVGCVYVKDLKKLICAPVRTFKRMNTKHIVIVPGDVKKSEAAKKISSKFDVSVDYAMKILPPGGIEIED